MSAARQRGRPGPGAGRWLGLALGATILAGASFAGGLYVGQWWSAEARRAEAEPVRRAAAAKRSGLAEPVAGPRRDPSEKLTFYQTLTAPLAPMPPPATAPGPARPAPERRPEAAPAADPPAPAPAEPDRPGADGREWTVQVGVFRDRGPADRLRAELAEAGTEAHVVEASAPDGPLLYKVRVGVFRTRAAADQMARRVSAERRLPTYVTVR